MVHMIFFLVSLEINCIFVGTSQSVNNLSRMDIGFAFYILMIVTSSTLLRPDNSKKVSKMFFFSFFPFLL